MLKNKKILSLLLAGIMTLSLAACSGGKTAVTPAPIPAAEGKPTEPTTAPELNKDSYIGEYTDSDSGSAGMEIAEGENGAFVVQVSIYRLTTFSDGVGTLTSDGLRFTATDASGNPISGVITLKGNEATVTITDSTWELLPNGEQFVYTKTGDQPTLWEESVAVPYDAGSVVEESTEDGWLTPTSTHKVVVTDQSVTTFQDNYGDEYKTIIPKLIVDGKEADSINSALLDHINRNHPLTKNEYGVNGEETRYAWGIRGDIVSIIIIASETFTDGVGYDVFSYNVETLQAASNDEIIKSFGMTADEFCNKVADAYRAFWDSRTYLQENMSDLDKSIGAISLANVTPFITPDGNLGAAGRIYVTGSQFPESVTCFNLDTLKVEYFAEE